MSISSIALDSTWRDYWGSWSPLVESLIAPLEKSKCHAGRIAVVPSLDNAVVGASGNIRFNFHLVPGSLIFGVIMTPFVTFQITDLNLGHQLFQEPLDSFTTVGVDGNQEGLMPSLFLFPAPWPVTGDGLFRFDAWASPGTNVFCLLHVAEVTDCPVR